MQLDTPITRQETGRLIYQMTSRLAAPVDRVWSAISDPVEWRRWDSMLMELSGEMKQGSRIKLKSKIAPDQIFKLQVSTFQPNSKMVLKSGFWPMFTGVRTYTLTGENDQTHLRLEETFSGLMLPMIKRKLPDCEAIFGTYLRDLKQELSSGIEN